MSLYPLSDVAKTLGNVALVHQHMGNHDKALMCFLEILVMFQNEYGTEHGDVATTFNNIGICCMEKGDFDRALLNYNEALRIRNKMYGMGHINVAKTEENIANVRISSDNFAISHK